jgi:DNA-directed RNA polymerase specialized sigma24 family protein
MPAPPSDPTAADASSDASLPANDAAPSSGRAVRAVASEPPPPSGVAANPMRAALLQFLASREKKKGRDWIRRVIVKKLGDGLEPALLEDLVQQANIDALEAGSPPVFEWGIPGWVARVTRRAIAHYFQAKKDDDEYLDHDAIATDQFDRHAPQPDWAAREHLINKWMHKQIGHDPVKMATLGLMMEAHVVGRSLRELALENHTTESALSNRFHKLRTELAPKVARMDEEKPRMLILLGLFLFGLGALVAAIVLAWHHFFAAPPPLQLLILPDPSASAAPAPSFDQAFPTQPVPSSEADAGRLKP